MTRDELITTHMEKAERIARSMYNRKYYWLARVEVEDAISAAYVGLCDAAARYDEHHGVTFYTFMSHRVVGAICDLLRESDFASRQHRTRCHEQEALEEQLAQVLGRWPTQAEVEEATGQDYLVDAQLCEMPEEVEERLASTTLPPDEFAQDAQRASIVRDVVARLPEGMADLLDAYYWHDATLEQASAQMGCTTFWAAQLRHRAHEQLRPHLVDAGVAAAG